MAVPSNVRPRPVPVVSEGPLTKLITLIERAAWAGWPTTVRLITLLTVAAAAAALVITASR
jgi:hypothetical protein